MKVWLSELRGDRSQREIAEQCGITQQAYSLIEMEKQLPSVKTAKAIAKTLNFDWTRFFTNDNSQGCNKGA